MVELEDFLFLLLRLFFGFFGFLGLFGFSSSGSLGDFFLRFFCDGSGFGYRLIGHFSHFLLGRFDYCLFGFLSHRFFGFFGSLFLFVSSFCLRFLSGFFLLLRRLGSLFLAREFFQVNLAYRRKARLGFVGHDGFHHLRLFGGSLFLLLFLGLEALVTLLPFSLTLLGFLLEILVGSKLGGEQGYLLVGQLRVQVVLHRTTLLFQEVDGALPSNI